MRLVVINIGNIDYARHSVPFIKQLCKKNGITFTLLKKDIKQNTYKLHPSWVKLFLHDLYDDEFIIWWDADLVPCRMYDLKQYFDTSKLNFALDSSHIDHGFNFNNKFKYNCGLGGSPKKYAEDLRNIYLINGKEPEYPSYEQYYVNDWIYDNKIDVHVLPKELNRTRADLDFEEDTLNMHYSHIDRSKLIKEHYKKYKDALND